QQVIKMIDESENLSQLREVRGESRALFKKIERDGDRRPLRIAVTGEIYVVWEPFVNLNIETKLGEMGVEVVRCLWLSENILHRIHLDFWNWRSKSRALKAAEPYLGYDVGAECNVSVGNTITARRRGYDGLIHLMPFTCMPEIVAQSILPKVSRHYDMPVLTFILDEHTGEAGMVTRLEAFVDLLVRRRERRKGKPLIGFANGFLSQPGRV
ncbi:CoA protein activase, partial [candidate division NPL-UPA2 bacterium]|nr:CoA protein activase [candidate division NPL-UPA2 bacterium]